MRRNDLFCQHVVVCWNQYFGNCSIPSFTDLINPLGGRRHIKMLFKMLCMFSEMKDSTLKMDQPHGKYCPFLWKSYIFMADLGVNYVIYSAGNVQAMKPMQFCTGFITCTFPSSLT